MHSTLTESQPVAAWVAEGADLAARRDALARQILAARQARDRQSADHKADVETATRAGTPIPVRPEPADLSHLDRALWVQDADEQSHRDRRAAVIASVADEILPKLQQRERDRQERLVELLVKLDAIEAEAKRDAALVRDLLQAQDRDHHVHPSRADRVPRPDLPTLLAAARAGRSLLEPQPRPTREREGMVLVDRDRKRPPEPDLSHLPAEPPRQGPRRLGEI